MRHKWSPIWLLQYHGVVSFKLEAANLPFLKECPKRFAKSTWICHLLSGIRIQSISQNLLVKRCEREQPLKQMAISCRWPMSRLEWSRTTKLASLKIQIIAVDFVVGSAITTRIEPPYLTVLKCSIRATRKGRKLVVIRFMAATHGLNGTAKHR